MAKTIAVHSFRRGVGKTSLAANLSTQLALNGKRVALVDVDFHAPCAYQFFGLRDEDITLSLNSFLEGEHDILAVAQDLTARISLQGGGKLFLVSASPKPSDVTRSLRDGLDMTGYADAMAMLERELSLDFMVYDCSAGLNEDTLLTTAMTDDILLMLRPEQQNYQGTAVMVELARKLEIQSIHLVVNDVPESINAQELRQKVEETYGCDQVYVFPHADEFMALSNGQLFVLSFPEHMITEKIQALAKRL